jgi:hypothetical protein
MRGLGRGALLLLTAAEIGTVRTISAATMAATAPVHAEPVLSTITLIVTVLVLAGILLRLAAAGYECRETASVLPAFLAALVWLLIRLLLMLRTILHLLVARRERLGVTRQIRLLLRLARRVARLVLAHERLPIIVVPIKSLISILLRGSALLLGLLVVIGVLLTKLFLRGGDQAKVVLGMLIVVLSCDRIARTLGVARELDIFFRNVGSRTADFDVGTV